MYKTYFSLFFLLVSFRLFADEQTSWTVLKKDIVKYVKQMDGWCPDDKVDRMMELTWRERPEVFVEIGVFGGRSFLPVVAAMKHLKKGHAYGIDPWEVHPALVGNAKVHQDWWGELNFKAIYKKYMDLMHRKKLTDYFTNLKMTSQEALEFFEDGSIDILHIDGNHAEESALFDAVNWLPKVREGGYIWFDDVDWPSTTKAVAYLCEHCVLDSSSTLNDSYVLFQKKVRSNAHL